MLYEVLMWPVILCVVSWSSFVIFWSLKDYGCFSISQLQQYPKPVYRL
jgi:hypothetical protein